MRVSKAVLAAALVGPGLLLLAFTPETAQPQQSVSRRHQAVVLKDDSGAPVDPSAPSPAPYSPRATCGGCHPYDRITRAYHFTMGADLMSDDWGAKHRNRPWMLSPGQNGGQQHMSYAWLAKKVNHSEAEVGLSTYQFAQTCAVCHPGGSIFERDRDGRRLDVRQRAEPALAASLDGDYHRAAWDRSGVLEADCLMCHSPGYDMKARTEQLQKGNYRWAATAGAGVGDVKGAVNAGDPPILTYRPAAVENGRVLVTPGRSSDKNCLQCHGEAETKKRGHVWDGRNEDVHARIPCTTCHKTGPDHQVAKGHSNGVFLHDELDDPALSCAGCHTSGRLGAPKPSHRAVPASHLKELACVTCHVRDSNVTAVHTVDTTTGKSIGIPTNTAAHKYGETAPWQPAYFRLSNGQISVGNALLPSWWGNRVGNVIHPLTFSETGKAFEMVKDRIRDDNGDGKPEANTEDEITTMLGAVARVLQGGRFAAVSPAYVKGHEVWEIRGGVLVHGPHPQASPLRWTFSHNVSKAARALGAGGCTDCHDKPGGVFGTRVTVDPWGVDGKPVTVPAWKYLKLGKADPYLSQ